PVTDTSEFQRRASLHRLLNRVAKKGSERELVRAFIDAVAVWHDAESWGYVLDLAGRFRRGVPLPGSAEESAPRAIDAAAIAAESGVRESVLRLDAEQR